MIKLSEKWDINGFNMTQIIRIKDGPDHNGRSYVDGRHQVAIANVPHDVFGIDMAINIARFISMGPEILGTLETILAVMEDTENHCDENGKPYSDYLKGKELVDKARGLGL